MLHDLTRRAMLFTAALMALPTGASAQGSPAPAVVAVQAGKITVTGSSTVAPLMLEIAKAFEVAHPKVRIDVQSGGSSRGIGDARAGLADIGMASRALTTAEADLFGTVIARDGIGIIVHKSNPTSALTDAQIVDIFTGRITDWKEVGGKPGSITVVNKAEGRSTLELFLSHYGLKNSAIKAGVVIGDNQQGIKTVAGNAGAIGYVSIGSAEFEIGQGTALKLLSAGGVAATTVNVRNGTYPLSRPLTLVTKTKPTGAVAALLDFARSPAVHGIVKEQFFVAIDD